MAFSATPCREMTQDNPKHVKIKSGNVSGVLPGRKWETPLGEPHLDPWLVETDRAPSGRAGAGFFENPFRFDL